MHEKDTSPYASTNSANLAIFEKLQGLWMARAIHVAVRLGLPDLLASRPKKLSELALATATDESILHRLLRCLKHLGILTETPLGCNSSTPLSEQLQRDGSLYWLAMLYGEEWQLRAGERLEDSTRTGVSGMRQAFGTDAWTYLNHFMRGSCHAS